MIFIRERPRRYLTTSRAKIDQGLDRAVRCGWCNYGKWQLTLSDHKVVNFDINMQTILAIQVFCFLSSIILCTCFFALLNGGEKKIDEA